MSERPLAKVDLKRMARSFSLSLALHDLFNGSDDFSFGKNAKFNFRS